MDPSEFLPSPKSLPRRYSLPLIPSLGALEETEPNFQTRKALALPKSRTRFKDLRRSQKKNPCSYGQRPRCPQARRRNGIAAALLFPALFTHPSDRSERLRVLQRTKPSQPCPRISEARTPRCCRHSGALLKLRGRRGQRVPSSRRRSSARPPTHRRGGLPLPLPLPAPGSSGDSSSPSPARPASRPRRRSLRQGRRPRPAPANVIGRRRRQGRRQPISSAGPAGRDSGTPTDPGPRSALARYWLPAGARPRLLALPDARRPTRPRPLIYRGCLA